MKQRSGRVTKEQRAKLLHIMKQFKKLDDRVMLQNPGSKQPQRFVWDLVADELNAVVGPRKNSDQWRRCWYEWKQSAKRQRAQQRLFTTVTGKSWMDPDAPKLLSQLDLELLYMFANNDGANKSELDPLMQPLSGRTSNIQVRHFEFVPATTTQSTSMDKENSSHSTVKSDYTETIFKIEPIDNMDDCNETESSSNNLWQSIDDKDQAFRESDESEIDMKDPQLLRGMSSTLCRTELSESINNHQKEENSSNLLKEIIKYTRVIAEQTVQMSQNQNTIIAQQQDMIKILKRISDRESR